MTQGLFNLSATERLDKIAEVIEAVAGQKSSVQRVMLCGFLAVLPEDVLAHCCAAVGKAIRQAATQRDTAAKAAEAKARKKAA